MNRQWRKDASYLGESEEKSINSSSRLWGIIFPGQIELGGEKKPKAVQRLAKSESLVTLKFWRIREEGLLLQRTWNNAKSVSFGDMGRTRLGL